MSSPVDDFRQPRYSSSGNFETPSKRAPPKGRAGKSKRPEQDHYETDYTTGGESCDELEEDWIRYWVVSYLARLSVHLGQSSLGFCLPDWSWVVGFHSWTAGARDDISLGSFL